MAYLTVAQVRSRVPGLANTGTYLDAELTNLVSEFTDIAERFRGVAFESRSVTSEQIVRPGRDVKLANSKVRAISAASIDAVSLTAGELAALVVDKSVGVVSNGTWYGGNILLVTYTHGFDAPPEPLLRACAEYCRSVAFSDRSGQGRDVIAQSMDGSFTRYSTPDWNRGRPTGYLEVDRLLNSVADFRVPGVA